MHDRYPPYINIGTTIKRKLVKPGQRFEIKGYDSINLVVERIDNFVRIRGADGWIRRVYDDNPINEEIVYLL